MSELALVLSVDADNPVEHDLRLTNGQLTLIEGDEAVAQSIKVRLQFFKGEWFLDTRQGIPYFEEVYIKAPKLNVLRSIFRATLLGTPGVDSVDSLALSVDVATRKLTVSFVVVLDTGATLSSEDFGPFIIEV